MKVKLCRPLGVAWILMLGVVTAQAGEGRTPIWEPTIITASGKYVVTRDIVAPGGPVIDITVSGVDIDLNGFVLSAPPGAGPVIGSSAPVSNVALRNGLIVGGDEAIVLDDGRGYIVEDVQIAGSAAAFSGIVIGGTDFQLRRNVITDRAGIGILVSPGPFPETTGTIADNQISSTAEGIFLDRGSSVTIRNNRVEAPFSFGIHLVATNGSLLSQNTVETASDIGLLLEISDGNKLHNNVVRRSGSEGIALFGSSDNLLLDNVSSSNGFNGMLVDGNGNHIERNVLNSNGTGGGISFGLFIPGGFATPNVYRGNTALGNPGGPCPGFPGTTDFCDGTPGLNISPLGASGVPDNVMPFPL